MSLKKAGTLLFALLLGCANDQPVSIETSKTLPNGEPLVFALPSTKKLMISNNFGGVVINGCSEEATGAASMTITVQGEAARIKEDFADNVVLTMQENDTHVMLGVALENDIKGVDFRVSLSLRIPYAVACEVSADGSVFASELERPLRVSTRAGHVEIVDHTGGCSVTTETGDIKLDGIILPQGEQCEVTTGAGDIEIAIPAVPAALEASFTEAISVDENLPLNKTIAEANHFTADISDGPDFGCRRLLLTTQNGGVTVKEKYLPPVLYPQAPGNPCDSVLFVRTDRLAYHAGDTVFVRLHNGAPVPVYLNGDRLTCYEESGIFPHNVDNATANGESETWAESELTEICESTGDVITFRRLGFEESLDCFRVFTETGRFRIRVVYAERDQDYAFPFAVVSNSFYVGDN